MMFKTHLMFGIFLGLLFLKYFEIEQKYLFVGIVALFAILPDIDFHKSKIGKRFKPLSWLINVFLGHRGIIHSLLLAFVLYLLLFILFGGVWGSAALIGYFSHLFLDSFTKKGTRLLWPMRIRFTGIFKGNSTIDYLLFFLFLLGSIFLLL